MYELINKEDEKRERKHNAIKLPENLEQHNIPKYVVYYKECYDVKKKSYREYFKIENHPLNIDNKLYVTSKSNKINILEKLEEIKKMLLIIEEETPETKDIKDIPESETKDIPVIKENKISIILPKYVTIKKHEKDNNKYYLIYDKKIGNKRDTLKALCSKNTALSSNLELFIQKILEKFSN